MPAPVLAAAAPVPTPPTLFERIESRRYTQITSADDLSPALVLLVDELSRAELASAAGVPSDVTGAVAGSFPAAASSAVAAATSTAAASVASSAGRSTPSAPQPLDLATSTHLFSLLSRPASRGSDYSGRCNRASAYLRLDSSSLWQSVRHASAPLSALSDAAERAQEELGAFERGDAQARARLVLMELRQIARALRRKTRAKEAERQPAVANSGNASAGPSFALPKTPAPALSRASSLSSAMQGHAAGMLGHSTSAAAASVASSAGITAASASSSSPFLSPLLTSTLFAEELDLLLPALFLRCRNAGPSSSQQADSSTGLSDDEDDDDDDDEARGLASSATRVRKFTLPPKTEDEAMQTAATPATPATPAAATTAEQLQLASFPAAATSSAPPKPPSLFMPLCDLVLVLLHQGPQAGTRLLVRLAYARPAQLAELMDALFNLLHEQLAQLQERLIAQAQLLPSVAHSAPALSAAALALWQTTQAALRSAPFATAYAFVLALADLSPQKLGPFVRIRLAKIIEEVRLAPPVLSLLPAAPPTTMQSQPLFPASSAATVGASAALTPSAPTALSTPVRGRAPPPPQQPPPATAAGSSSSSNVPSTTASGGASAGGGFSLPPNTPRLLSTPSSSHGAAPQSGLPSSAMNASSGSASPSTAVLSFATPALLSTIVSHAWAPLVHFLPRMLLSVTLDVVGDAPAFLSGCFVRILTTPPPSSSATTVCLSWCHAIVDALRDARLDEDWNDPVGPAFQAALAQAAAAAATAAAAANKARSGAQQGDAAGGPGGVLNGELATVAPPPPSDKPKEKKKRKGPEARARHRERERIAKEEAAKLAAQQAAQQPQQQPPQQLKSSSRSATPGSSPSLGPQRGPVSSIPNLYGSPLKAANAASSSSSSSASQQQQQQQQTAFAVHAAMASPTLASVQRNEMRSRAGGGGGGVGIGTSGVALGDRLSSLAAAPHTVLLAHFSAVRFVGPVGEHVAALFRSGSVEALRARLGERVRRVTAELERAVTAAALAEESAAAASSRDITSGKDASLTPILLSQDAAARASLASSLSELLRLVRLYCWLQLHASFAIRARELELFQQAVWPITRAKYAVRALECSPTLLALFVQLQQHLLAFLCICPLASMTTPLGGSSNMVIASSPSSAPPSSAWAQTLASLVRLRVWQGECEAALLRMVVMRPPHVARALEKLLQLPSVGAEGSGTSFQPRLPGISNLLFQLGVCAAHKTTDLSHLLRVLLRVPLTVKQPPLLALHTPTAHLKEVHHGFLAQHVWPRFVLLPKLFAFDVAAEDDAKGEHKEDSAQTTEASVPIFARDARGFLVLRRPSSALLRACLRDRVSNVAHMLRPTPSALISLLPRPYLEFGVGFWLSKLLCLRGGGFIGEAGDNTAASSSSLFSSVDQHPLLSHPSVVSLMENLVLFDLSAAIVDLQQSQPNQLVGQGHHQPAERKRDQRLLKEHEVRQLLTLLLQTRSASSSSSFAPSSLPCVSELASPWSLALLVYFLLFHNGLCFTLAAKAIPDKPLAPEVLAMPTGVAGEEAQATNATTTTTTRNKNNNTHGSQNNMEDIATAASPTDDKSSGDHITLSSAPAAPFNNSMAGAICAASAAAPYPVALLDGLPLRGLMEYLKRLRFNLLLVRRRHAAGGGGSSSASQELFTALASVTALFVNLHRLLLKLYPEALIGFVLEPPQPQPHSVVDEASLHLDVRSDGSLAVLGLQSPRAPAAILAVVKQEGDGLNNNSHSAPSVEDLRALGQQIQAAYATGRHELRLSALQLLRDHLFAQEQDLSGADPSGGPVPSMSALADAFLWHVLRPLCAHTGTTSSLPPALSQLVSEVWSLLYASPLSSSVLVQRTLLLMLDDTSTCAVHGRDHQLRNRSQGPNESDWVSLEAMWPWEDMLLDPSAVLLEAFRGSALSSSSPVALLRMFLASFFHLQLAGSAFVSTLAKTDYVSSLILRQARHQASYARYTLALKLMGPGPSAAERNSRGHVTKEIDPMQLHLTHHVERALAVLLPPTPSPADATTKKEAPANASSPAATTTRTVVATAAADGDGRDFKRAKAELVADVSPSGAATTAKAQTDAKTKAEDGLPTKREDAMQDDATGSDAVLVATVAARHLPFLVSDRLLTPGEQGVFSSQYALAPPPGSADFDPLASEATERAATPTLRSFAFLLSNRAAVAQELLDRAAEVLLQQQVTAPSSGSSGLGPDMSEAAERVDVLLRYVSLLFTCSTPPSSGPQAPSSLLLLLLVQGVAADVLPLLFARFAPQLAALLEPEGPLLERVEAGTGDDEEDAASRKHFLQLLLLLRDALARIEEATEQPSQSVPGDWKATDVVAQLRHLAATKPGQYRAPLASWAAALQLFPSASPASPSSSSSLLPLLGVACQLAASML